MYVWIIHSSDFCILNDVKTSQNFMQRRVEISKLLQPRNSEKSPAAKLLRLSKDNIEDAGVPAVVPGGLEWNSNIPVVPPEFI